MKQMFLIVSFLLFFSSSSCAKPLEKNELLNVYQSTKQEKIEFPPLGNAKKIANGVLRYEAKLKRNSIVSNVWIYIPEKANQQKLPCIIIAPAGSRLIDGASLGEGSQAEHIPYVKAGFVVVAYDIDGESKDESEEATLKAMTAFKNSNAGLINQKNALDYALEKVSMINDDKIYVAGHSSAATHALLVAANEPRVKGVIAYAPATDIEKFLNENLDVFDDYVSGFRKFIAQSSPMNNTEKIKIPVFLFHSKDDSTVSIKMTEDFTEKLKKTNSDVTFIKTEKGGHHFSMINQGIPKAIEWLKSKVQ